VRDTCSPPRECVAPFRVRNERRHKRGKRTKQLTTEQKASRVWPLALSEQHLACNASVYNYYTPAILEFARPAAFYPST
jgi:hypothetical protein